MQRNYCMAGNWKMNLSPSETKIFLKELKEELKDSKNNLIVAPSFVCIPFAKEILQGSNIKIASQNMSNKESGAYTGEISPLMLKELVKFVILGHSERRTLYKESDEFINEKVLLALKYNLKVILCIGETLKERENEKLWQVIKEQIIKGLEGVNSSDMHNIILAYEPIWAIGTGKTASPQDAEEVHKFIRKEIESLYSSQVSESLIIQYGGSVKPENVKELMGMPNIDGALVGGASLKVQDFSKIAKFNNN